ncbi:MAG: alpha/beta hydrolase [Alphaproteobacteria bacterium]|nr:alpha/beta hydrolase [Alphaproteobacteria bacterium]
MTHALKPLIFSVLIAVCMSSSHAETPAHTHPITLGHGLDLQSGILKQTRRINIYLPPSYEGGEKRYPVLYMPDGGVGEDFIHIAGIASLAADFRNIREFIVVGVENIDRYRDLFPPSVAEIPYERLKSAGGSKKFRAFLRDELMPYIEAHYRTSDEKLLMGESAAGLFVLETLFMEPGLFGSYIAISPAMWWDDQALAKATPKLLRDNPAPAGTRLFLTIANEGSHGEIGAAMRTGTDKVADALSKHSTTTIDWTYDPMEEESHGTIFHPAALQAIRLFLRTNR